MYGDNRGSGGGRFGGNRGFGGGGRRFGGERRDFGPREMHKIKCSECGKEDEVPFEPKQGLPVYCKDCFMKKKGITPRSSHPAEEHKKPSEEESEEEMEEESDEEEAEKEAA